METACPWYVESDDYLGCCFLAAEAGEHTLAEIGDMLSISRERVRQIENAAIRKLKSKLRTRGIRDGFEHQQSMVVRGSSDTPEDQKPVAYNKDDDVRDVHDRIMDISRR